MGNHEISPSSDKGEKSSKKTPEKPFDPTKNASKEYKRKEASVRLKKLQEQVPNEDESQTSSTESDKFSLPSDIIRPNRALPLGDNRPQDRTLPRDAKVPMHESNSAGDETALRHSRDNEPTEKIEERHDSDDELAKAIKTIREAALDHDIQLRIEQLEKALQAYAQEHNKPVRSDNHLRHEIKKNKLEIYNGDNEHLLSIPLGKVYIKCFNSWLEDWQKHPYINAENSIIAIKDRIELIKNVEQLDKTLQDWNKHVDKTLKEYPQEHDQSEKPDNYQLYYKIEESKLSIYKGDNKYLFTLPLGKVPIEHLNSSLQIRKEHYSINETIKKLEEIGLDVSIEQLKETLQDWNGHIEKSLQEHTQEYNQRESPNKSQLYCEIQDNKLKIFNGDGKHLLFSLPLEIDDIERFCSDMQKRIEQSREHNSLVPEALVPEALEHGINNRNVQSQHSGEIKSDNSAASSPKASSFHDHHSQTTSPRTTKETHTPDKEKMVSSQGSANLIKKALYRHLGGRKDEINKRAAFDNLYKKAHNRSQEVINELITAPDLDSINIADTDSHPDAEKLRSEKIITRLNEAIGKFNRDIESLEETHKMIRQKKGEECENYKRDILQSIENDEHRREMQRREKFDQDYKGRRNALEQELLEEQKRRQDFNQYETVNYKEYSTEYDKRKKLNVKYKSHWDALEQERLKETQIRKDFDQQKKEDIHEKLYELNKEHVQEKFDEFMYNEHIRFGKWFTSTYREILSEFQKEIKQLKMAEDYRRYRKDSKFGTHEPKDKEQKEKKEPRKPEQHPLFHSLGRTTFSKKLAQTAYSTQGLTWMSALLPKRGR